MAWLKSKEQKQKAEQEAAEARARALQREQEAAHYREILSKVIITPESLESYQSRMGYAVEVIETSEIDKGVIFKKDGSQYLLIGDSSLTRRLVEAGIEALVETNITLETSVYGGGGLVRTNSSQLYYGLPVARKKGGPYR